MLICFELDIASKTITLNSLLNGTKNYDFLKSDIISHAVSMETSYFEKFE